jgi:hypothetical protein
MTQSIPMISMVRLAVLIAATALVGCKTIYHLPGHHESNRHSPPPISMKPGESKRILTAGLDWPILSAGPSYTIRSSDREIVAVNRGNRTVRLEANRPGTARVHYDAFFDIEPQNLGFEVKVLQP